MATKQPDSVMARLMRLDEHPPDRQPFRKQGRVLSDSYIRKAASVGLRHGSSVSGRRLCSTYGDTLHGVKGVPGVRIPNNNHDVLLDKRLRSTASKGKSMDDSVSKSLCGANYEEPFGVRDKHHAPAYVLRYPQKFECDSLSGHLDELGVDYENKFLKIQSETVDKPYLFSNGISVCEPKSVKLADNFEGVMFGLRPESGKSNHGLAYKKLVVNGIVSPRCNSIAHDQTMNRVSRQDRHRSNYNDVCRSGYKSEKKLVDEPQALMPSFPGLHDYKIYNHSRFSNKSYLASEAKRRNIKRCMVSKKVQEPRFFWRAQTLDEMLVSASGKPVPKNSNLKLGRNGCNLRHDGSTWRPKSKKQNISQKDILESLYWRGYEKVQFTTRVNGTIQSSKISEPSSRYFDSETNKAEPEAGIHGRCAKVEPGQIVSKFSINDPPSQDSVHVALANTEAIEIGFHHSESTEDMHSSYVQGFFHGEAPLHGFSEEESPYSSCSRICSSEFQDYSKGANHRSPDSVLEPVDSPNPSPFECFKNMDLLLQLQDLNFESEETYSEGSVMVVSGDNDSEERYNGIYPDNRKVQRWLGYHESRNFSYLVDVLNEAGFCTMSSFTNLKTWDSLEYPISSRLFETLEKKYGKQTSWDKSERHLLFDRINSGLVDIVNPVVSFHDRSTSMRKQFSSAWRRDEVEDELWMMLMREEEEKSRSLNEKVIGRAMKWLELEEDISFICRELETSLFDEVVMELASLCD